MSQYNNVIITRDVSYMYITQHEFNNLFSIEILLKKFFILQILSDSCQLFLSFHLIHPKVSLLK